MTEQNNCSNKPALSKGFANDIVNRDNVSYSEHQLQNSMHLAPPGMFERILPQPPVPPPMFRNFESDEMLPPAPITIPPPPLPPMSIPLLSMFPPPVPAQPAEIMSTCSKFKDNANAVELSADSFSLQQQQYWAQNLPVPSSNFMYFNELGVPSQGSTIVTPPDEGLHLSKAHDNVDEFWIKNWLKDIGKCQMETKKYLEKHDTVSSLPSSCLKVRFKLNNVSILFKIIFFLFG